MKGRILNAAPNMGVQIAHLEGDAVFTGGPVAVRAKTVNVPCPPCVWIAASTPPPPELHSEVTGVSTYLLLAIPGKDTALPGKYIGRHKEWRIAGRNEAQRPTHWMTLPALP